MGHGVLGSGGAVSVSQHTYDMLHSAAVMAPGKCTTAFALTSSAALSIAGMQVCHAKVHTQYADLSGLALCLSTIVHLVRQPGDEGRPVAARAPGPLHKQVQGQRLRVHKGESTIRAGSEQGHSGGSDARDPAADLNRLRGNPVQGLADVQQKGRHLRMSANTAVLQCAGGRHQQEAPAPLGCGAATESVLLSGVPANR